MESKIARGFDRRVIDVENHIRNYTPRSWIVPINNVDDIPRFRTDEIKIFLELHNQGILKNKLEELSKENKFPPSQLKPGYIKEAINDFFDKNLYKEYEKEL